LPIMPSIAESCPVATGSVWSMSDASRMGVGTKMFRSSYYPEHKVLN
jgi:hypothetical protein